MNYLDDNNWHCTLLRPIVTVAFFYIFSSINKSMSRAAVIAATTRKTLKSFQFHKGYWPKNYGKLATFSQNVFSIKVFFSICEQIRRKLQICSHLVKKFLMESFILVQYVSRFLYWNNFQWPSGSVSYYRCWLFISSNKDLKLKLQSWTK